MKNIMNALLDDSDICAEKEMPVVFMIDFSAPQFSESVLFGEKRKYSFIVRVEPEDASFILSLPEVEEGAETFAEALAKRTVSFAIEKDLPNAFELTLSAQQIDRLPDEFENRLPDFCMNGNKAWMVCQRETLESHRRTNMDDRTAIHHAHARKAETPLLIG